MPKGWRVVSGGSALGQHPVADGKETATFAAAGVRGALGIAASAEYDELTEQADGVELRASSMQGEPGARALISCGRAALRSMQKRFGPYPWSSLSLAEASLTGGAGGVELPGLAIVARMLSPRAPSPLGMFDFTCYHEVAHQWWQALVGSDPRRAPWVDEALAQYSAVLVVEDAKGRAAADQALSTFVGVELSRYADGARSRWTRLAAGWRIPFAARVCGLVYGKAPLFFDRARELLGNEHFDAATRLYRQFWAFREAGGDGWLSAARRVDPDHAEELAELQKRWWDEKHGDEDVPPPDGLALMDALGGTGLSQLVRTLQQDGGPDEAQMRAALKQLEKLMPEMSRMLEEGEER